MPKGRKTLRAKHFAFVLGDAFTAEKPLALRAAGDGLAGQMIQAALMDEDWHATNQDGGALSMGGDSAGA